jgi:hypothetical protein
MTFERREGEDVLCIAAYAMIEQDIYCQILVMEW